MAGAVVGNQRCLVAPENVTSQWLPKGGVNISWTHRHYHRQRTSCQFLIEYRTVGQWVPLTQAVNATWFMWKTASRGALYHFRVISQDFTNTLQSPPSLPILLETGGTPRHPPPVDVETDLN